jgi:hypothetical protein
MAKYRVLKSERDDAVARALEAERLSRVEEIRRLEDELARLVRERDEALAEVSVAGLRELGREIWGPDRLTLEGVVVRLGVDLGKLARIARGADKDQGILNQATLELAMGNIIFSCIRWCDDLGFDPRDGLARAVRCQREFAERNVNR